MLPGSRRPTPTPLAFPPPMHTRRDFLKNAALLSGATGAFHALPGCLSRALMIDPEPGSTWADAEHVVILMQENRSFDHAYGALRGVRGFNDPRAITLADGLPVWCQTGGDGKTHTPFRLDIHNSKSTWTGCLPHSRGSQVEAFNRGRHDQWLMAKQSGAHQYAGLPLTLGHYDRRDIPFYYALADAFTVCDQHFCSAMTCTTPNRCYLWSGTVQGPEDAAPRLDNGQLDHNHHPHWTTFPERLEDHGISWKVYQNEIDLVAGHLPGEKDEWLGNFGDNPLEYFPQYGAKFAAAHQAHLARLAESLPAEIARAQAASAAAPADAKLAEKLAGLRRQRTQVEKALVAFSPAAFAKLPARDRALHTRAFTVNAGDANRHELEAMPYADGADRRSVNVPKGDLFHQFRADVKAGVLPAVSWLVAPQKCSDHPDSAWYGAWYVSEALDILTADPKVWKKTIFILTYDENDGYFDHVPPFVPPPAGDASTGAASPGLDTAGEFDEHGHPIGLGFRVPMVIASPWTRGGRVNSQVFDHTSVLQFLEKFTQKKTGTAVRETNISPWRRAVCGDLTSAFLPESGANAPLPEPVARAPFVAGIHQAQFRPAPAPGRALTPEECAKLRANPRDCDALPRQEPGTRPSCPLPYELHASGRLNRADQTFAVTFEARDAAFGADAAGAAFNVYAPGKYSGENTRMWSYAAIAGGGAAGTWPVAAFENGTYHLRAHGPNGFYREFQGDLNDPDLAISCDGEMSGGKPSGNLALSLAHTGAGGPLTVEIADCAYGAAGQSQTLAPGQRTTLILDLGHSFNWYDFRITVAGAANFAQRLAGRMETGTLGVSDPAMAG